MRFPEGSLRSRADFKRWYANIGQTIASNTHTLESVKVSVLGGGRYQAEIVGLWQAESKKGEYNEGPWVNHPLFQPRTFKERVHQAASLIRHYSCTAHPITTPVLIDEMDNRFWCSYGYLPNSAFLINKDGIIAFRESWFAPKGTDGKPNLTNIKAAIEALP